MFSHFNKILSGEKYLWNIWLKEIKGAAKRKTPHLPSEALQVSDKMIYLKPWFKQALVANKQIKTKGYVNVNSLEM